eukprot:TRINITY_DN42458_c0_g1_i1.p2 TRINITY_DN42458_c0_g1~~TRINITY_DN42458_c0_g1_i1.p2  ORF type:complete len:133 (+),score=43.22 TRINITY_DN42458_c0_g1_i1:111-509(+)
MNAFSVAQAPCICAVVAQWSGGVSAAATVGTGGFTMASLLAANEIERELERSRGRSSLLLGAAPPTGSNATENEKEDGEDDLGLAATLGSAATSVGNALDALDGGLAAGFGLLFPSSSSTDAVAPPAAAKVV